MYEGSWIQTLASQDKTKTETKTKTKEKVNAQEVEKIVYSGSLKSYF
jgi:hypothetical protein